MKYDSENPAWNMLALSMEATCNPSFLPDRSVLDIELNSKRIYDQNSFVLILKAFLLGRIEQNSDDENLISYSDNIGADIKVLIAVRYLVLHQQSAVKFRKKVWRIEIITIGIFFL